MRSGLPWIWFVSGVLGGTIKFNRFQYLSATNLRVEEHVRALGAVVGEDVAGEVEAQHEQQQAVRTGATLQRKISLQPPEYGQQVINKGQG